MWKGASLWRCKACDHELINETEECPACYRILYLHELEKELGAHGIPVPTIQIKWDKKLEKWIKR